MNPWLDSLSEDWIPQPRSSSPSLPLQSSTASDRSSAHHPPSSRIPRYKARPQPGGPPKSRGESRPTTRQEQASNGGHGVLSVRSPSKNNSSQLAPMDASTSPADEEAPGKSNRRVSQSLSSASVQTTRQHPVALYRSLSSSPRKQRRKQDTPEWKRRLLGEAAVYAQRDLFGPIGLENIFQPPPESATPRRPIIPRSQPINHPEPDANNVTRPVHGGECRKVLNHGSENLSQGDGTSDTGRSRRSSAFELRHGAAVTAGNDSEATEASSVVIGRHMNRDGDRDDRLDRNRTVSANSAAKNEDISPIFVSRQGVVGGMAQYDAHDSSQSQRQSEGSMVREEGPPGQSQLNDTTFGTHDFVSHGGFINTRRGGFYSEGSFQMKKLSPSSLPRPEDSFATRDASIDTGTPQSLPGIRTAEHVTSHDGKQSRASSPSDLPHTPVASPSRGGKGADPSKSSKSPLKLFGGYDTFTNDKLLRRMSQFEDTIHDHEIDELQRTSQLGLEVDESDTSRIPRRSGTRISSFGQGQLDEYVFDESSVSSFNDGRALSSSRGHGSSHVDGLDRDRVAPRARRRRRATSARRRHNRDGETSGEDHAGDDLGVALVVDGKRPPSSPAKGRVSKRRRTLTRLEMETLSSERAQEATEALTAAKNLLVGKKRKDARYHDDGGTADPDRVAARRILKARMPTPHQHRGDQSDLGPAVHLYGEKPPRIRAYACTTDLSHPQPGQHPSGEIRKGSVTTQDFLDEATKIMEQIRAKGRRHSALASLEESAMEDVKETTREKASSKATADSSYEDFSRPASRDGGGTLRRQALIVPDPQILDHLAKYAESDLESKTRPTSADSRDVTASGLSAAVMRTQGQIQSEPNNIRILGHTVGLHTETSREGAKGDVLAAGRGQADSQGSSATGGTSSGQTGRGSSSGRSETRHVIGPERVSHLIPGHIAGMTYDHARQTWVSRKEHGTSQASGKGAASETSEEDPLGNIPDLSVDEKAERIRTQAVAAAAMAEEMKLPPTTLESALAAAETGNGERPATRAGSFLMVADSSSLPSKSSNLASSGPRTETRATSWGDEVHTQRTKAHVGDHVQPALDPAPSKDGVEEEIQLHEGRGADPETRGAGPRRGRRDVTITFSSPLVSQVMGTPVSEESFHDSLGWSGAQAVRHGTVDIEHDWEHSVVGGRGRRRASSGRHVQGQTRVMGRPTSFATRSFTLHPFARIDEQYEESHGASDLRASGTRRTSLDVCVAAPLLPSEDVTAMMAPSMPALERRANVSFHLSPLPDFTLNQGDETSGREISYLAKRVEKVPSTALQGLSQVTSNLVQQLTDIEPYEPYWEQIRQLDLRGRRLNGLHRLQDFCGRLEVLNLSENQLAQLNGAPASLRHLTVAYNHLSNMTAWGHLGNLQSLDLSGNQIDSLEGLKGLVHLREIKADDNQISSLEGVFQLDGLTSLRARRNRLSRVDFATAQLKRLGALDLKGNQIHSVRNLHHLPALSHLELGSNALVEFEVKPTAPLKRLRFLGLEKNWLGNLDTSPMPHLRILHVDENRLQEIHGLRSHKHLELISMREQCTSPHPSSRMQTEPQTEPEPEMKADDYFEVRKLYYSGNHLSTLSLGLNFLNLHVLELASSGLQELPADFGHRARNLRQLSLNFNALRDLGPLEGIVRLHKLHVAGNRLDRLRKTSAALALLPSLCDLDLRNNPLSVGFYPPAIERRVVTYRGTAADGNCEEGDGDCRHDYDADAAVFHLPLAGSASDTAYRARLDRDTKLRRRVYEMLVASSCPSLRTLDGLRFDRMHVLGRDRFWACLGGLGVVRGAFEADGGEEEYEGGEREDEDGDGHEDEDGVD
ncbi:MAG: hypothetical protein M1838_003681 [Thelocarpon superellum]|nr:MAG: hypothetical protein M1838_003681 [Thelocarpon superellum]